MAAIRPIRLRVKPRVRVKNLHWIAQAFLPERLVAAGAEFLPEVQEVPEVKGASELLGCGSRVVKINGRVYCEGNLARNVFSHNSANIKNGAS